MCSWRSEPFRRSAVSVYGSFLLPFLFISCWIRSVPLGIWIETQKADFHLIVLNLSVWNWISWFAKEQSIIWNRISRLRGLKIQRLLLSEELKLQMHFNTIALNTNWIIFRNWLDTRLHFESQHEVTAQAEGFQFTFLMAPVSLHTLPSLCTTCSFTSSCTSAHRHKGSHPPHFSCPCRSSHQSTVFPPNPEWMWTSRHEQGLKTGMFGLQLQSGAERGDTPHHEGGRGGRGRGRGGAIHQLTVQKAETELSAQTSGVVKLRCEREDEGCLFPPPLQKREDRGKWAGRLHKRKVSGSALSPRVASSAFFTPVDCCSRLLDYIHALKLTQLFPHTAPVKSLDPLYFSGFSSFLFVKIHLMSRTNDRLLFLFTSLNGSWQILNDLLQVLTRDIRCTPAVPQYNRTDDLQHKKKARHSTSLKTSDEAYLVPEKHRRWRPHGAG